MKFVKINKSLTIDIDKVDYACEHLDIDISSGLGLEKGSEYFLVLKPETVQVEEKWFQYFCKLDGVMKFKGWVDGKVLMATVTNMFEANYAVRVNRISSFSTHCLPSPDSKLERVYLITMENGRKIEIPKTTYDSLKHGYFDE